jgi:hypothetical protein
MRLASTVYGYRATNCDNHVYRNLTISGRSNTAFAAVSAGPTRSKEPLHSIIHDGGGTTGGILRLTVDGLTFEGIYGQGRSDNSLINIFDIGDFPPAVHFRNVRQDRLEGGKRELVTVTPRGLVPAQDAAGSLARLPPRLLRRRPPRQGRLGTLETPRQRRPPIPGGIAVDLQAQRHAMPVAEVKDVEFPKLLDPIDDLPPTTVITHVAETGDGKLRVRGATAENGTVKRVVVKGQRGEGPSGRLLPVGGGHDR